MRDARKAAPVGPGRGPAALAVVYLTVFIDLLGFGIILPSLPYYAQSLGANGLRLGLLFTSYSFAQLVAASFLGRLSDRFGRRPILMASLAGSAVSMAIAGFSHGFVLLLAARFFAGAFGGSISAAQAYIADVTTHENRAQYMGFLGASIGLGFVLGPSLGAGISFAGGGFAGAAFTAAGLAAANLVLAFFALPETRTRRAAAEAGTAPRSGWTAYVGALRSRTRAPLLVSTFLLTFAFVALETTFAFFGKARFGFDERAFGLTLAAIGLVGIAIQGGAVGQLTRRLGVRPVTVAGTCCLGAGLLALPFSPGRTLAYGALLLVAIGQALASPTLSTLLSQATADDEQGLVLGTGQSFSALARATGPLVAGALYDRAIPAPYLLAAVAALAASALVASASGAPGPGGRGLDGRGLGRGKPAGAA